MGCGTEISGRRSWKFWARRDFNPHTLAANSQHGGERRSFSTAAEWSAAVQVASGDEEITSRFAGPRDGCSWEHKQGQRSCFGYCFNERMWFNSAVKDFRCRNMESDREIFTDWEHQINCCLLRKGFLKTMRLINMGKHIQIQEKQKVSQTWFSGCPPRLSRWKFIIQFCSFVLKCVL